MSSQKNKAPVSCVWSQHSITHVTLRDMRLRLRLRLLLLIPHAAGAAQAGAVWLL
jgi:hypothetical protein